MTIDDESTDSTYFTYQIPVHSTSNTCGSSTAGEIFQDRDTGADLEQVRLQIKTIMKIGSRVSYAEWHRIFTYMIVFRSKI